MKVTLEDGNEYYELESPGGGCFVHDIRCACWSQSSTFCSAAPCYSPPIIFLTKEMYLKRITDRLTS